RLEAPPLEELEHRRLDGPPLRRQRQRGREVGDAEDRRHALAYEREVRAGVEIQHQPAREPPNPAHAASGRGLEEIPAELPEEQRPVPALEADLVVMDDDARGR